MKQRIIEKIPMEAKSIKVIGQGCNDDCKNWKEVSGKNYPRNGGMFGCYVRSCTGYYYYDAHWTTWF